MSIVAMMSLVPIVLKVLVVPENLWRPRGYGASATYGAYGVFGAHRPGARGAEGAPGACLWCLSRICGPYDPHGA